MKRHGALRVVLDLDSKVVKALKTQKQTPDETLPDLCARLLKGLAQEADMRAHAVIGKERAAAVGAANGGRRSTTAPQQRHSGSGIVYDSKYPEFFTSTAPTRTKRSGKPKPAPKKGIAAGKALPPKSSSHPPPPSTEGRLQRSVDVLKRRYQRANVTGDDPRQVAVIGETLAAAQASLKRTRKARR